MAPFTTVMQLLGLVWLVASSELITAIHGQPDSPGNN
jgi:hypothetical protein